MQLKGITMTERSLAQQTHDKVLEIKGILDRLVHIVDRHEKSISGTGNIPGMRAEIYVLQRDNRKWGKVWATVLAGTILAVIAAIFSNISWRPAQAEQPSAVVEKQKSSENWEAF